MVVWSTMKPLLSRIIPNTLTAARRTMSGDHRIFPIEPSRFQWNKFKDLVHLYILVGAIPVGLIVFYSNIFIGPATLSEIPEDYVPKHWEYYRHPITRFIARYVLNPPQQDYEKYLHLLFEEDEKRSIRRVEKEITQKMKERADYKAYYYRPVLGKYHRAVRESSEAVGRLSGD